MGIHLVFAILLIAMSLHGQPVTQGNRPVPSSAATLVGLGVDMTPDYSTTAMDALEKAFAETPDKDDAWFRKHPESNNWVRALLNMDWGRASPVAGVEVKLTEEFMRTVDRCVTDQHGRFRFSDVQVPKTYALVAEWPDPATPNRPVFTKKRIAMLSDVTNAIAEDACLRLGPFWKSQIANNDGLPYIVARSDGVTIRGKVTDESGHPVAGVEITGSPVTLRPRHSDWMMNPSRQTLTDAQGNFELHGFFPPSLRMVSEYLCGQHCISRHPGDGYQVSLYTLDKRFLRDAVTTVPIIPERLIAPARRLIGMFQKDARHDELKNMREKKDIYLPTSEGDVITGVHVVLKRAGDAKK
jgi:hypothetical protein